MELVARPRFELLSKGPKPSIIVRQTTWNHDTPPLSFKAETRLPSLAVSGQREGAYIVSPTMRIPCSEPVRRRKRAFTVYPSTSPDVFHL